MEPPIRYATTRDGVSIACCALGEDATQPPLEQRVPLVVLPTGPWSPMQLEWQVPPLRAWYERLVQRYRPIRYDLRGSGHSGGAALDFGLEAQVLDLAAVVDGLGLECCALLAPQTAGLAAIAYAARHPERVSHLVLWCTFARGADYYGAPQARALLSLMAQDWELFVETVTHARFGWLGGETAHRFAALVREHLAPAMVDAYVAAVLAIDATPLLPLVRAPTLVLHRRGLPYPDVGVARGLAAGIPGARLALLDGASMSLVGPGDEAEVIVRLIDAFLGVGPTTPASAPAAVEPSPAAAAAQPLVEPLSERELEVLRLVAAGLSNHDVAQTLVVTVGTVKTHLNHIYGKLDVRSRT